MMRFRGHEIKQVHRCLAMLEYEMRHNWRPSVVLSLYRLIIVEQQYVSRSNDWHRRCVSGDGVPARRRPHHLHRVSSTHPRHQAATDPSRPCRRPSSAGVRLWSTGGHPSGGADAGTSTALHFTGWSVHVVDVTPTWCIHQCSAAAASIQPTGISPSISLFDCLFVCVCLSG